MGLERGRGTRRVIVELALVSLERGMLSKSEHQEEQLKQNGTFSTSVFACLFGFVTQASYNRPVFQQSLQCPRYVVEHA